MMGVFGELDADKHDKDDMFVPDVPLEADEPKEGAMSVMWSDSPQLVIPDTAPEEGPDDAEMERSAALTSEFGEFDDTPDELD